MASEARNLKPAAGIAPVLLPVGLVLLTASAHAPEPLGAWRSLPLENNAHWAALASSPIRPGRILAAGHGVFRSDDAGDSWTVADGGLPRDIQITLLAASPADPDVFSAYARVHGLHRTTDAGASWVEFASPAPGAPIGALLPDPVDPDGLWAGSGLASTGGVAGKATPSSAAFGFSTSNL